MKILDTSTLFGKPTEHENKLERLETPEAKYKKKEKVKEEKKIISLKASSSKEFVKDNKDISDEDFSKDKEMSLFFHCYNKYMKKRH